MHEFATKVVEDTIKAVEDMIRETTCCTAESLRQDLKYRKNPEHPASTEVAKLVLELSRTRSATQGQ